VSNHSVTAEISPQFARFEPQLPVFEVDLWFKSLLINPPNKREKFLNNFTTVTRSICP
jgi:hypothetical protein